MALLGCCFIAWPALHGPLVHDSVKLYALEDTVAQNPQAPLLNTPFFGDRFPGRIVAMASFVANVAAADGLSSFALKTSNLALHLLLGILAASLAWALCRAAGKENIASPIGLATASLWLLAPANLSASMYAIQRMAQLSTLFTITGLLFYLALRETTLKTTRSALLSIGLLASLTLGIASKENGLLLLPLIALVELTLHGWHGWRTLPRVARLCTLLALTVGGAFALGYAAEGLDYSGRPWTISQRLITEARVIWLYLFDLIIPIGNDPGIVFPVQSSTSLLQPASTLPAIFGILAVLGLAIFLRVRGHMLTSLGILFFFTAHLMESTIVPLELAYMHRNYLPSFGIYLALSAGAISLAHRVGKRPVMITGLMLLSLFVITGFSRMLTWSSETRYHTAVYNHHPESRRAALNYSSILARNDRPDTALEVLEMGLAHYYPRDAIAEAARLYFKCVSGASFGQDDFDRLSNAKHGTLAIELSQALSNLAIRIENGCEELDPALLANGLSALAKRERAQNGPTWHIDYYVAIFRDQAGMAQRADAYLRARMRQGEPRAGLYLAQRLLDRLLAKEALATLNQMQGFFEDIAVGPYRNDFERLKLRAHKNLTEPQPKNNVRW